MTTPIEYPTAQWASWIEPMNDLKNALYRLAGKRQIFDAHNEVLKQTPVPPNDPTGHVHAWLRDNYYDSMRIGLRCVLDRRRHTLSLRTILEELADNSYALSFDRYRRIWVNSGFSGWEECAREAYAPFTKDGRNFDAERVRQDLEELETQHNDLLEHVNTRVAHWTSGPSPDVTVGDLNRMLDDVCTVFHEYYQFIAAATIMDFPELPFPPGFERAFERLVNSSLDPAPEAWWESEP